MSLPDECWIGGIPVHRYVEQAGIQVHTRRSYRHVPHIITINVEAL
jgi:hypothetical protein